MGYLPYLWGTEFQGSVDGKTWDVLTTVDGDATRAKNTKIINSEKAYRYVRLYKDYIYNRWSYFRWSALNIIGYKYSNMKGSDTFKCPVVARVDGIIYNLGKLVTYKGGDATPGVENVSPTIGSVSGKQKIVLTGSNLGYTTADLKIEIDGVTCSDIQMVEGNKKVSCITGEKENDNNDGIVLKRNGKVAIVSDTAEYLYAKKFSS